jgi:hypothetical protein
MVGFMQPEEYTPEAIRKMRLAVKNAQKRACQVYGRFLDR